MTDFEMAQPIMSASNIVKSFSGQPSVLRGIDFNVHRGEVVSLIGPSGSGKTTFLRCLAMLESLNGGEVFYEGELISSSTLNKKAIKRARNLRAEIGMVFQQFNLWPHMKVIDNVTEALVRVKGVKREQAILIAEPLLEKVGLLSKKNEYPRRLSGGQQQRVAIARALAMSPKILLFDEPTSALDPEVRQEVLSVMRTLAEEGMTMLVVTHEMGFARDVCSRVVFMDGGNIIEDSHPEDFFNAPSSERARKFLNQLSA